MRHLYDKPHLNRSKSHRKALFGNMSAALFLNKRITTTLGKARFARRFAERMITFARKGDVAARRHVLRFIQNKDAIKTLFDELGPHFKHREGGYTRIIKIGSRRGDAAPMAIIELVGFDDAVSSTAPKKDSKSKLKTSQKTAVSEKKTEKKRKKTAKSAEEVAAPETTVDAAPEEIKGDTEISAESSETAEEIEASDEETVSDSTVTNEQESEEKKEDSDK
ncbi:50S ribosomal protein L17 [bacterium]|nr:50S ribosomal protein L17 [bacterium]